MTGRAAESFDRLVERLSTASVARRWEAYRDVDWDDPGLHVDPGDPRWELPEWDPLGATGWYREQPAPVRAEAGLWRVLFLLKVGIEFETVLQQGLLAFASGLPNGHPAFRYAYHEITEEAQHSMMFQELINRSGMDVVGSPDQVRSLFGTTSGDAGGWGMFFFAALAAENAFDQLQRRFLATGGQHPLFRRICEIHVAEEARHLSFARAFLRQEVPRQSSRQRRLICLRAPFVVEWTTRQILCPDGLVDVLTRGWQLPAEVQESVTDGPAASRLRRSCSVGVVRLGDELGLVDPRLAARWAALGTVALPPDGVAP